MRASVSARLVASASVNGPPGRGAASVSDFTDEASDVGRSEVGGPTSAFNETSGRGREASAGGLAASEAGGGESSSWGVERCSGEGSSFLLSVVAEGSGVGVEVDSRGVVSGVEVANAVGSLNALVGLALATGSGVCSEIGGGVDATGVALGSLRPGSTGRSFSGPAVGFGVSRAGIGEGFATTSVLDGLGSGGGSASALRRSATISAGTFMFEGAAPRAHAVTRPPSTK